MVVISLENELRLLASKNLNISNLNYPQNLIFNLKNAVQTLTSNFKVFFNDFQKTETF